MAWRFRNDGCRLVAMAWSGGFRGFFCGEVIGGCGSRWSVDGGGQGAALMLCR